MVHQDRLNVAEEVGIDRLSRLKLQDGSYCSGR